jgi:hypothetical protein
LFFTLLVTRRRGVEEAYRFLSGISGVVAGASAQARSKYIAQLNQAYQAWRKAMSSTFVDSTSSSQLTDKQMLAVKLFRAMLKGPVDGEST